MSNIEENRPRCDMFSLSLYKMVVDSVEGEREGFQVDQHTHDDMYTVDGLATGAQYEGPQRGAHEEDEGHHAVEDRERHLAGRQVVTVVTLEDFNLERKCSLLF